MKIPEVNPRLDLMLLLVFNQMESIMYGILMLFSTPLEYRLECSTWRSMKNNAVA